MDVHVIDDRNRLCYQQELEQDQILRHRIFVDELGWQALRRPDGRERDQYDGGPTSHLLLLKHGQVTGGLRLTPLSAPNLLLDHFADMIERPLPGSRAEGADWTRFYVTERRGHRLGPQSPAGILYCSAMEYALDRHWHYLTFVSKPAMIEILLSIGWKVMPLGMPRIIERDTAIAAWIEVSHEALYRARDFMGLEASLLRQNMPMGAQYERPEMPVFH